MHVILYQMVQKNHYISTEKEESEQIIKLKVKMLTIGLKTKGYLGI